MKSSLFSFLQRLIRASKNTQYWHKKWHTLFLGGFLVTCVFVGKFKYFSFRRVLI